MLTHENYAVLRFQIKAALRYINKIQIMKKISIFLLVEVTLAF